MAPETVPIIGVSLGHRHQKTAISVTERVYVPVGTPFTQVRYDGPNGRRRLEAREEVTVEYHVRHLERHGPPSRYSKIAQRLPEIVHEIGGDVALVVDLTATGRPIYSLIRQEMVRGLEGAGIHFKPCPITVTGIAGGVSKSPDVGYLVPRRDLISATQVLFDEGQLKIAEALSLADALREELLTFTPKGTKPGDDLEGWREGKDDDLVLAVATSLWAAERFLRKEESVPADGGYLRGATA